MQVRRVFGRSVPVPLLAALVVGFAVLAAWGFVAAFRASPERRAIVIAPPPSARSSVAAREVRRWIDAGLPTLTAHRAAAWRAALPARGSAARQALRDLYGHLAPIPWSGLHAVVSAISGQPATFDVKIEGRPGGAGPPQRIVAERLLVVERSGGRLVADGDQSPAGIRHEYLMAFRTPHALVADGAVVVFDESWRPLAEKLAGDMPRARADLAAKLGVTGDRPIVVMLYSTPTEITRYLGQSKVLERERFFARLPTTTSSKPWWPTDVGVLASALTPADSWTEHMLAHEVTHTLTWRWFYNSPHAPPLLLEGMATAVEGDRSYWPLRAEVAAGNRSMPLLTTFARPDLWTGVRMARVTLAYLEGAALVKYILAHWGEAALKRFSVDIAGGTLAGPAVKQTVRADLGVSWSSFYAGWKAYVMTLQ